MKLAILFMASSIVLAMVAERPAAAQPGAPMAADVKDKDVVKAAEFAVKAQQEAMKLKFKTYDRPYFVKNTFERNAAQSFAVLKSLA